MITEDLKPIEPAAGGDGSAYLRNDKNNIVPSYPSDGNQYELRNGQWVLTAYLEPPIGYDGKHIDPTKPDSRPEVVPDAGMRAKAAVALRQTTAAAKYIVKRVIQLGVLAIIVALAAGAYYGYSTHTVGFTNDSRSCSVKVGDQTLTGTRTSSYKYLDVFGFRSINTSAIDEKTVVNLNGGQMTVIELDGDKWRATLNNIGDRGMQILKHADSYVFTSGKNVGVIKYADFCK